MKKLILLLFIANCSLLFVSAQNNNPSVINSGCDIMNRYVWRGLDYGASPSFQPTISFAKSGFELGTWGAISLSGSYSEIDLYAKYTIKGFSAIVTDYFFPIDGIPQENFQKYFRYEKDITGHAIEGALQYKGTEKFPISIYAGTFVYGNDRKENGDSRYSTYLELGYSAVLNSTKLDFFAGFTPDEGLYGNGPGFINLGITAYKSIKISDKFDLPVKTSIITNPQTQNIYLLFGITL